MKNRSKKMCGHGEFVNQRSEDCSLHTVMFVTLVFKGILSEERKLKLQCPKRYGIRPTDSRHTKLCVMYTFESDLVMNENVRFRFLCTGYFKQVYRYNKFRNALPKTKQKIKNKLFRNIHIDSDFVVNKVSISIYKKYCRRLNYFFYLP